MRVFLCGAQGTGKSTLVNQLPSHLKLERKDSFSKRFLDNDPFIQTKDNVGYDEFQDKILLFCLSEYVNHNDFISSRSIIDSYAYLSANESKHEIVLKNILTHYSEYLFNDDDIYVYLPVEFKISTANNENRNTDAEYQAAVDVQMRRYFDKFSRTHHKSQFIILEGDIKTRLEKLIDIISTVKEKECLR